MKDNELIDHVKVWFERNKDAREAFNKNVFGKFLRERLKEVGHWKAKQRGNPERGGIRRFLNRNMEFLNSTLKSMGIQNAPATIKETEILLKSKYSNSKFFAKAMKLIGEIQDFENRLNAKSPESEIAKQNADLIKNSVIKILKETERN